MIRFLKEKRGFITFIMETITLLAITYPISILYKAFTTGTNSLGEEYFNVNPITGSLAILLVFACVLLYSNEFYHIQKKMGENREKLKRIVTWILYILFIIIQIAITAILFLYSLVDSVIYVYMFEAENLNNLMFVSVLGIITPLSYLWLAIIRKVLVSENKKQER